MRHNRKGARTTSTPFPIRAKAALERAGYKQGRNEPAFFMKSGRCTVVLKNKFTLDVFRGYHQQVAGLLVQDGSVYPLTALDILNVKEIV